MNIFKNKRIFVTGGTGSFGSQFVKTLLSNFKPGQVVIYSRDELKQFEMKNTLSKTERRKTRFFIGDVRDSERLKLALSGVDIVVHAAALKQVDAAEYNPFEVVKTNILGAQNLIFNCLEHNIDKVLALSTDKACSPINLYGASKLASDKLFISANGITGSKKCKFSVLRYGNVFGSRGSVAPYFKKLNKSKLPLNVTDLNMTRFSLSLEEGVNYAIKSLTMMIGGELFVPKAPSYRLKDLVKVFGSKQKIKLVGLRSGEKIHEDLISNSDALNTYDIGEFYVIAPNLNTINWNLKKFKNKNNLRKIKKCENDFSYSSDKNIDFLSLPSLKKLINDI